MRDNDAAAQVRALVCYARPGEVFLREVELSAGSTIAQAIAAAGLLQACPQIDPASARVGIFGKLKTMETVVREGDRVEVYRGLVADPKSARQRRVQKTRAAGSREGHKWRGGGQ
ncbi:RnfH family protein [Cupriavidus sp. USMAA2-4]|uniref:UPF0125 protein BKK80_10280 n=1 Tax=Cupriavidus malaysiensis TaxID=367825 RepID=A0ABM6F4C6_9BURK|nr:MULTISPECIES: RnfH family protein [Cupriavidus]AOY90864.1 RnfH family protein [Cupriavidus sp. USMAA2-4]AOY99533.1 RnfH family protein [Cupriavidus sp. USMAHM13]AOZ06178.1 RnfH family protein [Cupriavidus malaysiensis]